MFTWKCICDKEEIAESDHVTISYYCAPRNLYVKRRFKTYKFAIYSSLKLPQLSHHFKWRALKTVQLQFTNFFVLKLNFLYLVITHFINSNFKIILVRESFGFRIEIFQELRLEFWPEFPFPNIVTK